MTKRIITTLIILWPALAFGAPFLVCDPDPDATSYIVKVDDTAEAEVTAPLRFDLINIPIGQHRIEVRAKNALWGATSSAVPFEFVRPSLSITNIHLEP